MFVWRVADAVMAVRDRWPKGRVVIIYGEEPPCICNLSDGPFLRADVLNNPPDRWPLWAEAKHRSYMPVAICHAAARLALREQEPGR